MVQMLEECKGKKFKGWILALQNIKFGKSFTVEEIFNKRIEDKFWGIGEKTPNQKNFTKRVIFFIGVSKKIFACITKFVSSFKLDGFQKKYGQGEQLYTQDSWVLLKEIDIWYNSKLITNLGF